MNYTRPIGKSEIIERESKPLVLNDSIIQQVENGAFSSASSVNAHSQKVAQREEAFWLEQDTQPVHGCGGVAGQTLVNDLRNVGSPAHCLEHMVCLEMDKKGGKGISTGSTRRTGIRSLEARTQFNQVERDLTPHEFKIEINLPESMRRFEAWRIVSEVVQKLV